MSSSISFITLINKYFNQGYFTSKDKLFSTLSPSYPFKKNSQVVYDKFRHINHQPLKTSSSEFHIKAYNGKNKNIELIADYLKSNLKEDLHAAIIHGSMATYDEIAYSDYDGLLILNDEVYESPDKISEVGIKISKAYSLLISCDPLQHHGWFIVNKRNLENWPASFFPPVLLKYSKSLLGNDLDLSVRFKEDHRNDISNLNRLIGSLEKTLSTKTIPDNLYQLKSLFSEFMLLPALYLQVKTNQGVYKKYSFEQALKYFQHSDWEIMNEVSGIRMQWPQNSSDLNLKKPQIVNRRLKRKQLTLSHHIPAEISSKLTPDFQDRMLKLVQLFKN